LEADGRVIENHYRSQVMDVNVDMFSVMMNQDAMYQESDDDSDSWQQSVPPSQMQTINTNHSEIPVIRRENHAHEASHQQQNLQQLHHHQSTHVPCGNNPSELSPSSGHQSTPVSSDATAARNSALPRPSVDTTCSDESRGGRILSVNDILLRFWSINSRLAFTGLVVQRWVTCWIIFVVLWVAQMIVYWIKNDTLVQEVFLVAIPLVLLPLVCSALSEVNFEGDRVIRRLCPTSERLDLLLFLTNNPLHLTIYGQTVRFGNMSNGLIGLATALFTGIAINKFMKNVH